MDQLVCIQYWEVPAIATEHGRTNKPIFTARWLLYIVTAAAVVRLYYLILCTSMYAYLASMSCRDSGLSWMGWTTAAVSTYPPAPTSSYSMLVPHKIYIYSVYIVYGAYLTPWPLGPAVIRGVPETPAVTQQGTIRIFVRIRSCLVMTAHFLHSPFKTPPFPQQGSSSTCILIVIGRIF